MINKKFIKMKMLTKRKNNIYIDGLFYKGSGIGRYYESLIKELAKKDVKIITSVPKRSKNDFEKDFAGIPNIKPIFVDYEKFSIKGFFNHSKLLKSLESKVDIFFYPHINLPYYIPKNTIVTIHDLIPLTKWWDGNWIKRRIFRIFFKRAINYSRGIITISETTKKDILRFYPNIESKIKVIYEFIDEKFYLKINDKALVATPYILFVGNRKVHKNIKNLIIAFNNIRNKLDIKLVIAGVKDINVQKDEVDLLIKNLNLKNDILEFVSPDDKTLLNLYSNATLFVFPSLYEGFGLPPLEAISCGCPTITSNILVLKEILGEKIACFNPYSVDDIAEKMLFYLKNKEKREELLLIGKERLKFFNKTKIMDEYLKYFKQIIENENSSNK